MRLLQEDVEALLTRQARARLPLARQLLLYLDPFALFKDASRGAAYLQEMALAYNRGLRWLLASYLRRWVMIAASLFIAIEPAEAAAGQISYVPAGAAGGGFRGGLRHRRARPGLSRGRIHPAGAPARALPAARHLLSNGCGTAAAH